MVLGEALPSADNSGKTFGRSELRPEPRWESSQRFLRALAGGGRGLPPPQEPNPSASIFGPSGLLGQPMKNPRPAHA